MLSSTLSATILIATDETSDSDTLAAALDQCDSDLQFQICTSRNEAMEALTANPYQLTIASAKFATLDDFVLLRKALSLRMSMPFIVTVVKQEHQTAQGLLERGIFDVLPIQAAARHHVTTIDGALRQSALLHLIKTKHETIKKLRLAMKKYSRNASLSANAHNASGSQDMMCTLKNTITRLRESMKILSQRAAYAQDDNHARRIVELDPWMATGVCR